jgi:hypothetical protein
MQIVQMLLEAAEKNAPIREHHITVLCFLLPIDSDKWEYFIECEEMSNAHIL